MATNSAIIEAIRKMCSDEDMRGHFARGELVDSVVITIWGCASYEMVDYTAYIRVARLVAGIGDSFEAVPTLADFSFRIEVSDPYMLRSVDFADVAGPLDLARCSLRIYPGQTISDRLRLSLESAEYLSEARFEVYLQDDLALGFTLVTGDGNA